MAQDIFSMKDKTVVFTGGGGNLGRVMVRSLLDYGATVIVPEIVDSFDESFDAEKKAGKLHVLISNLKTTEGTKEAFAKAYELGGNKIDVLVTA